LIGNLRCPLPNFRIVPVDKLVRLLETRNGNFHFFNDVHGSCDAFKNTPQSLLASKELMRIATFCAGVPEKSVETLLERADFLRDRISQAVKINEFSTSRPSNTQWEALNRFVSLKESQFIDTVRGNYDDLRRCSENLREAVERSLVNPDKSLKYDQVSDVLYVKEIDTSLRPETRKRYVPDDGARKRHTTDHILRAEAEYREAANRAKDNARRIIEKLCSDISADKSLMEALIFFSHWAVVVSTVCLHVEASLRRGWSIPTLVEDGCSRLESAWPYWLDLNNPAIANTVTLTSGHTSVLTAPNMSGKSTLTRTIASIVLLGNCGLMVPCKNAIIHKVSDLLIVSPSGDRPSESLSAFASEAEAMSSAIRHSASNRKVVLLVDEFGRGTSGNDATALSAAVIKYLTKRENVACIWATHLHELFVLSGLNVSWIKMEGFRLMSGQCIDSKGIEIAKDRGFPNHIIETARALRGSCSQSGNSERILSTCDDITDIFPAHISRQSILRIGVDSSLPPLLQSGHIVYVLRMTDDSLYVGETDNFARRLIEHRQRFRDRIQDIWIVDQPDRTEARALETALIQGFLRRSIPLVSIKDGLHHNRAIGS
jgi:DNA mismatch repair ATPase MutS